MLQCSSPLFFIQRQPFVHNIGARLTFALRRRPFLPAAPFDDVGFLSSRDGRSSGRTRQGCTRWSIDAFAAATGTIRGDAAALDTLLGSPAALCFVSAVHMVRQLLQSFEASIGSVGSRCGRSVLGRPVNPLLPLLFQLLQLFPLHHLWPGRHFSDIAARVIAIASDTTIALDAIFRRD